MTEQAQIYLASRSPRRHALLQQIGLPFLPLTVDVDEAAGEEESAEVYVIRLALEKARAGWAQLAGDAPRLPVLGADTAVVLDDGRILGKPVNRSDGLAMLEQLSGRVHRVLTGLALVDDREATRLSVSSVGFRELDRADMEAYWVTGEPADKAGAYAIQGRGAVFVNHLEGSYSGVMGLPLYEVTDLLAEFSLDFRQSW
ncbi:Maf family nucleotide pyrophosphatase [Methylonatrum kenyense]|uniref:Maf family protein n=1 Tax=Methylonatrum kenyense TaxID=455253 RepID=UPI0020C0DFC7|nr:Maf family protein [Methylonatrum kenyense]MCK8516245.1 Maf family nucleotide pyrophosphatase [Methylonatrum kenyense]